MLNNSNSNKNRYNTRGQVIYKWYQLKTKYLYSTSVKKYISICKIHKEMSDVSTFVQEKVSTLRAQ